MILFLQASFGAIVIEEDLQSQIRKILVKQFPKTEIEIKSVVVSPISNEGVKRVSEIQWVRQHSRGYGELKKGNQSIIVEFKAWIEGFTTKRKIAPGEKLSLALLERGKFDVSQGEGRWLRDLVLPIHEEIDVLETIQTIPQGQPLLLSAVKRIPDVKVGDLIQIHIKNENLELNLPAIAQENANLGESLKLMVRDTKKVFEGRLTHKHLAEVAL